MSAVLETLTDYEAAGLKNHFCLADGHAYQDLHPSYQKIIRTLPQIWRDAAEQSIPDAELSFNKSFASFINSPILENFTSNFKICPTASNSIDLIGATLNHLKHKVVMVEPTFDNLSLLLRRRGVNLDSFSDAAFFAAAESNEIENRFPGLKNYNALVLVHPNNPTGLVLSENAFKNVIEFCIRHKIILILDNCFRAYRRDNYYDYNILIQSSVSFMTIEDTGKVWPTQDLKASLVYFSDDLKNVFCQFYNEIYLCVSNLSLGILSAFFNETASTGLKNTIWDLVDLRRRTLRKMISGSKLIVSEQSEHSNLSVEWLSYVDNDKNDFKICHELKQLNLAVLPGRQFYWNSSEVHHNHKNIRISLMKRESIFLIGMNILQKYCETL